MITHSHCNVDSDTFADMDGDVWNGSEVIVTIILIYSYNFETDNYLR